MGGDKLLLLIDGQEIASCSETTLEISHLSKQSNDWPGDASTSELIGIKNLVDYNKPTKVEKVLFEYYMRRGKRHYFRHGGAKLSGEIPQSEWHYFKYGKSYEVTINA